MNLPFFIAKRYFTSKKSANFSHIVSLVSFFGVMIGTTALVLMLAVFNGFEDLVLRMYNSFHPHLQITSCEGKTFNIDLVNDKIKERNDILSLAFVLEEAVLLRHEDKEFVAVVKGVSETYKDVTNFDSLLIDGNYINEYNTNNVGVIGSGVAYYLSIPLGTIFTPLEVFAANRNSKTLLNTNNAFQKSNIIPVGVFSIQAEIDEKYIITPLIFVQELINKKEQASSIEIKLKNEDDILLAQQNIQQLLGQKYIVKNRFEQQEFLYKILNSERLAVFVILIFIMIIAAFNIIGSTTILILEKKKEIFILNSFGVTQKQIQNIFFNTSMLMVSSAAISGIIFGGVLAIAQKKLGIIGMGNGNFVIDVYPVSLDFMSVFLVFTTVIIIGLIVSWYPCKILTHQLFKK